MESSVDSPKIELKPSVDSAIENGSGGIPFRSAHLSNKERLLLRKQALKMKKRPVLAIGNIIALHLGYLGYKARLIYYPPEHCPNYL